MNIPSIEELLSELDEVRRERDEWHDDCRTYCEQMHKREEQITKLQAERDELKKENQIERNLRIGVEAGFDCANEEIGRRGAWIDELHVTVAKLTAERDAALEHIDNVNQIICDPYSWCDDLDVLRKIEKLLRDGSKLIGDKL